ncbi:MAG: MarR family transcriptional regulator [Pseudomonadota bacterium]
MSVDRLYRLHASLGYQLSLTSRMQEKRLDEKLKTLGLTRLSWCILLAVENEGLFRPSDIADFVGTDRTATSRILRGMEADGLIRRESGLGDRRTTHVAATALGREKVTDATPYARENSAWMASKLADGEEAVLRRLLDKLRSGEVISLDRF